MTSVHIITSNFPPSPGGLELWTEWLANGLAAAGFDLHVHVLNPASDDLPQSPAYQVHCLRRNHALCEEPLLHSNYPPSKVAAERSRFDVLALSNHLRNAQRQGGDHILLSNYAIHAGALAATVAQELHLPHVAVVVGTDFSRGFRTVPERFAFLQTISTAALVVTKNRQQADAIAEYVPRDRIRQFYTSVPAEALRLRWRPHHRDHVDLFSDSGFSYKKGTQILLRAFGRLRTAGMPLRLTVCGANEPEEMDYWAHLREQYASQYESAVEFPGHIPLAEVLSRMMDCDVYCSASLGEGSSMARGMALCLGVPIVTTNCGEAADLASDVSHVRLADPMDADGYQAQLQAMCQDSLANRVTVCGQSVAEWRRMLEPAIEMSGWVEALRTLPAR